MPRAPLDLLRSRDVRDAYRLIGECRDLGNDPDAWPRHMFDGLRTLVGTPAATGGEGRWLRPTGRVEVLSSFDTGLDAAARTSFLAYMHANGPEADPLYHAIRHVPERFVTRTRRMLLSDAAWYRSAIYDQYCRASDCDDRLMSVCQTSEDGAISTIHLQRARHDRPFSDREHALLSFFHQELAPLLGRALVSTSEPRLDRLPPRLRQTLACLLEGDTERQIAARLGLSRATVHQYVTMLYRRFGVRSRAQLTAHVTRRRARRADE